jgi:hypothetical protein
MNETGLDISNINRATSARWREPDIYTKEILKMKWITQKHMKAHNIILQLLQDVKYSSLLHAQRDQRDLQPQKEGT